jgi:hypothetical protein
MLGRIFGSCYHDIRAILVCTLMRDLHFSGEVNVVVDWIDGMTGMIDEYL